MASSLVPENWATIKGSGGGGVIEGVEFPEVDDGSLLRSLLDESYGDSDDNEEKLRSVIQSLEAEINLTDGDSSGQTGFGGGYGDSRGNGTQQMEGLHCSISPNVDFEWIDLEVAPSQPLNGLMDHWQHVDPCEEVMGNMVEDYSSEFDYGLALEEHPYSCSLWQESAEDWNNIQNH